MSETKEQPESLDEKVDKALTGLEAHERECKVRNEYIEKRFDRLDSNQSKLFYAVLGMPTLMAALVVFFLKFI